LARHGFRQHIGGEEIGELQAWYESSVAISLCFSSHSRDGSAMERNWIVVFVHGRVLVFQGGRFWCSTDEWETFSPVPRGLGAAMAPALDERCIWIRAEVSFSTFSRQLDS